MKVCLNLKNTELRAVFVSIEQLITEQKNPYDARAIALVLEAAREWADYVDVVDAKYRKALERNPNFDGL